MSRLRANQIVNRDANGPIEATEGLLLSANKHTIYQSGSSVVDVNLNELIKFGTTASAVNEITVTNATISGTPTISATGNDTNISLGLTPKGTGTVNVTGSLVTRPASNQDAVAIAGRAGGSSSFAVTIQPTTLTANRTLTLADGDLTLVAASTATVDFGSGGTVVYSSVRQELYELDDISLVDDIENTFSLSSNYQEVIISDPFKLLVTIDGVLQNAYVHDEEYVFPSYVLDSSKYGYTIDYDNKIKFTKSVSSTSRVVIRTVDGSTKATSKIYPFSATNIMLN